MAIVKAQSSSSPTYECTYDVFLSFRGADTRKTFTDNLYTALTDAGFKAFRDEDEIESGKNIKSELVKAIKESSMSVIVFSKNYVNSRACLYEVETMLEHSKKSEHIILPVFYDVDPLEIKKQAKSLVSAEEFARHDETHERQQESMDKVKAWSTALKEVAAMAGLVLKNRADGHESKFIKEIVKDVKNKLTFGVLSIGRHLIGMKSRVKNINLWLKDRSPDVTIVLICGMGGIGKTTIARSVYNLNKTRFDRSSFLANVREVCKETKGIVSLQRQLLSDILHNKVDKIYSVDKGLDKIKRALYKKRVLLVLDDVDERDQLDAILGLRNWFSPGTKIIITTRKDQLLNNDEIYKVHKVEKLSDSESLELFCWHAFRQKHAIEGYMGLSKRFVDHCDGLPLALEVLGSSIFMQSIDVWESALKKLEAVFDQTILVKLRISYDSLPDDHDRNLFLDIALFFVGKNKDDAVTVLDGCDYCTAVGIQNFIVRNLLTIEEDKLRMHQLLQDMGKTIVSQESKYPWKRSRLWRHLESYKVIRDENGTEQVEGFILDMNMLKKDESARTNTNHHSRQFPNEAVLKTDALGKMPNLKLLKLNYVELNGSYEVFPKRLILLSWCGFHLKSMPTGFPLGDLVALDMRHSNLQQLWKGTKVLGSLKILNLSYCPHLAKTPDFSTTPNLGKLILKHCPSLLKVDESIINLEGLFSLNFQHCKNLRELPRNISAVKSLEQLKISGCLNLNGLAEELQKMESLTVLHANGIPVHQLLCGNRKDLPWYASILSWVPNIRENPDISWTSLPSSLVDLSLVNSNLSENDFPQSFAHLSKLKSLYLRENPISSLPDCIKDLTSLQKLDLSWCPRLQQIQWPPIEIEELLVTESRSLEIITFQSTAGPRRISHGACVNLDYVQWGFKIEPVGKINVEVINNIGFFNLDSMANVELTIVNVIVWSTKKCPIQILYEDGIFSTYFPGREVPDWFSNKNTGSTISFIVPAFPYLKIKGLNLSVVYTIAGIIDRLPIPIRARFINKSKRREGIYTPRCYGVPEVGEDIVWLSYVGFGNLFEEGDEVQVSFDMMIDGEIKECGAHILYYEEEEEVSQYWMSLLTSWDSNMWSNWLSILQALEHDAELREYEEEIA